MLFESTNQFWIALCFVWLGILVASCSELILFKTKNKGVNYVLDFCFWCGAIVLFFIWITHFAGTNIRFYCILSFFVGFLLVKIFWHNLIAKFKKLFYNIINNLWQAYKKEHSQIKLQKDIAKNEKKKRKLEKQKLKKEQQKDNGHAKPQRKKHNKRRITHDRKQIKNVS